MKYLYEKRNGKTMDPRRKAEMAEEYGISGMLAELLILRGITEDAGAFLNPGIRNMHDPYLFCDMKKTVDMIRAHVRDGRKITVFGDYDSDGICAAAILYLALKTMNADVSAVLPNRSDGYGLSMKAVTDIARSGAGLLITVDCGISNSDEVRAAKEAGMAVIITDHHECPDELPDADAILNPKRKGEAYPFRELAGGGVAFKVAVALTGKKAFEMIDLAAVATIGDVVPLLDENRIIAAKGLYKLNAAPSLGLAVLMDEAGLKKRPVDSEGVAFGLVPRINAAGRIGDPKTALALICAQKSRTELQPLARSLCALNARRQELQESIISQGMSMAEAYADARVLVLQEDEWEPGIVGLAASALAGSFAKPALLLGRRDGLYVGSARSVPGVNLYEALKKAGHLMEAFGGHEAAAGVTVRQENLQILRETLNRHMFENYSEENFMRKAFYDMEARLPDVTADLACEIRRLMPFGCGNEPVKLLLRNVQVLDKRPIGNGSHSRMRISQDGAVINAVAFKTVCEEIPGKMDALACPQVNDFNGNTEVVLDAISF